MEEDRKSLYFGWLASSALIAVAVCWLISGALAGMSAADAVLYFFLIYAIVLMVWIAPFIFMRAVVSELRDRTRAGRGTGKSS